ncbi:MAG: deoxyribodipyrimidine photo-lyase [Methanothrix sp.]|nr:deoxyribodipyrimidine photo-lyase [Methanothrix sp.]
MPINQKRIRKQGRSPLGDGPVVYWMSRDQRVRDNWALLYAQELALKNDAPLGVFFCLIPEFMGATTRQYHFMLKGLKEVERNLQSMNIPFFLMHGNSMQEIDSFLSDHGACAIVADFSPLRHSREWKKSLEGQSCLPFCEVDAHNIVPCWMASSKQEWAAYTFRPKVHRLLNEFLEEFPALRKHPFTWKGEAENDWSLAERSIHADRVAPVKWIEPGEAAAEKQLHDFLKCRLSRYNSERNDPARDGQSGLSPYLHFGQISAQRVALQASSYDSIRCFPDWGRETLEKHGLDRREYIYTQEELERGRTHDDLWNAAQSEMVNRGKMHGYLRMYWAKKILEWTKSPAIAQQTAVYLNDRYELDGRDPNGYVGIAWSIGGVHDRAWKERPIFGKVRYMSHDGASRKFHIEHYIRKVQSAIET